MRALPSPELLEQWPAFTVQSPLRVLISGCLAGNAVGYDGSTYGRHPHIARLMALDNVRAVAFCPENFSFGTPRALCDIHGGDGRDVLAGRARVLTADGADWTDGMIAGAREMLRVAQEAGVRLAILMDISAACGSQVIYAGARPAAPYRIGHGVAAALLAEHGLAVVSQRDFRTLERIFIKLGVTADLGRDPKDHHETEWYRSQFGSAASAG